MLKIDALSKRLGNFAMKDICLNVEEGDYYIIVGPSGAGKSVLLETIAGLNRLHGLGGGGQPLPIDVSPAHAPAPFHRQEN